MNSNITAIELTRIGYNQVDLKITKKNGDQEITTINKGETYIPGTVLLFTTASVDKLAGWACDLNSSPWDWPEDMPGKPLDWDEIPDYSERHLKDRASITRALYMFIGCIIGAKEIVRHYVKDRFGHSDEEFENHWSEEEIQRKWLVNFGFGEIGKGE